MGYIVFEKKKKKELVGWGSELLKENEQGVV